MLPVKRIFQAVAEKGLVPIQQIPEDLFVVIPDNVWNCFEIKNETPDHIREGNVSLLGTLGQFAGVSVECGKTVGESLLQRCGQHLTFKTHCQIFVEAGCAVFCLSGF